MSSRLGDDGRVSAQDPPVTTRAAANPRVRLLAAIAVLVWIAYRWADRLVALLGPSRARVVGRIAAFLLLCIGTQIVVTGATDIIQGIVAQAR